MSGNIQCQRGLPHRWTRGNDDELTRPETTCEPVQISKSCSYTGNRGFGGGNLIDIVQHLCADLIDLDKALMMG